MKLDDLQNPSSAAVMAQLLKKHHGIQMPVDQMTARTATTMLENVQRKLTKFRNTHASHVAERNSDYLAMLMVEQTLKAKISEEVPTFGSELKKIHTTLKNRVKSVAGDVVDSVKTNVPGARVYSPVTKTDSGEKMGDMYKRLRGIGSDNVIPKTAAKQSAIDAASAKLGANPNDLKTLANKPTLSAKEAMNLAQMMQQLLKNPGAAQALNKLTESVIMESSVGEAEVVLAAKDMVDRIQDMVETMGKMVNEELPALNETIRDTMTSEQADAFTASATGAINAALENIRETKNALDAATRILAGEEPAAELTGLSEPDMTDVDPTEPEPGSEEQNLVEPEPLGRGKR